MMLLCITRLPYIWSGGPKKLSMPSIYLHFIITCYVVCLSIQCHMLEFSFILGLIPPSTTHAWTVGHSCRINVLFHLHFLEISMFIYILEDHLHVKVYYRFRGNFTLLDVFCSRQLFLTLYLHIYTNIHLQPQADLFLHHFKIVANFPRTLQDYIMNLEMGHLFWGSFVQFFSYYSHFTIKFWEKKIEEHFPTFSWIWNHCTFFLKKTLNKCHYAYMLILTLHTYAHVYVNYYACLEKSLRSYWRPFRITLQWLYYPSWYLQITLTRLYHRKIELQLKESWDLN